MIQFRNRLAALALFAPAALAACGGGGMKAPNVARSDPLQLPEYVWDSQVFKTPKDPGPARIQPVFRRNPNGVGDPAIELLDRRDAGAACLEYQLEVAIERKVQCWAVYRVREILPSGTEVVYYVTDPPGRSYEGASRGSFVPDDRNNRAYDKSHNCTKVESLFLNDFPVKCEWEVVRGDARDWIDPESAEGRERVVLAPPPEILREGSRGATSLLMCSKELLELQATGEPRFTAIVRLSPENWRHGEGDASAIVKLYGRTPISQSRIGAALDAVGNAPAPAP